MISCVNLFVAYSALSSTTDTCAGMIFDPEEVVQVHSTPAVAVKD